MWLPFFFAYSLFHLCLETPGVWGRAPSGDSKRKRGLNEKKLPIREVFYSEKNPVK